MDFRLLSYSKGSAVARAGLLVKGLVFDATDALGGGSASAVSVLQLLADWDKVRPALESFASGTAGIKSKGLELDAVTLAAPLLYPGAVYCAGANYRDHVIEMAKANNQAPNMDGRENDVAPWHFVKPSKACVTGSGMIVVRPAGCLKLDWEAELVAVIGRAARNVSVEDALDYVAGYTAANDLSARDLSRRALVAAGSPFYYDWMAHKCFAGSCPLGPWITPASQVGDPQNLPIKLWVNGVLKQDSNTSEMIYSISEQIAHISRLVTLEPGDIVLTGTPAGVGAARQEFLQPGDLVRIEIGDLGELNTLIA